MNTITHMLAGAVIAKAIDDKNIGNWGTMIPKGFNRKDL
jgi:hypothetical protein